MNQKKFKIGFPRFNKTLKEKSKIHLIKKLLFQIVIKAVKK